MKKSIFLLLATALCITVVVLVLSGKKAQLNFENKQESFHNEKEEHLEGRQTGVEKQMSMWTWSKGYPNPTHLSEKYRKAWEQAQEIKKNTPFGNNVAAREQGISSFGNWSVLGNVANIGGRVLNIAIDPTNTSRIFIGTASGGIYKTTNAGSSWSYVPTGFYTLGVSSILIDPVDPNILYAGTGEVYRVDTSNIGFNVWKARGTYGVGILKSIDGGTTWTQVLYKEMSELFAIQMLKFDPNNSNTIYACTTHGLYKSTDAGATWGSPILNKIYVSDVAINPSNSNQIVAAVGNMVNADKGVYRSTNGGSSWTASPNATVGSSFKGYIRFDNAGSTRLFASVGNGSGNELYMSTDFGSTWIQKTSSSHCGGQYWFGHDVAVDPSNTNRVVMGGVSYYSYTSSSSTGSAGTRSTFASGVHADVHDIKFDPTNSNIIYIANDGGMYKATDGANFSRINTGLNATQFYASLAVSPTADIIIGGLQDNGVVKYDAGTWTSGLVGGDGGPSAFAPNGTTVLYSNDARAVYHSTTTGGSESQRLLNLGYGYASAYDDRTAFMSPLGISKSNPSYMYVASDNLHISTNGGTSFQRPDPATDMTRPIDALRKPAIALAISPTDHNKVYVSTSPVSQRDDDALNLNSPARVLKSLNASDNTNYSFANITGTLPDRFVTDFAISRFSDDSVYITLGGFGNTHVYLTADGGATWTPRGSGLPDIPFNAIVIDPVNPGVLYAACDFGVYVSPDKGVNWYDFNTGFSDATLVLDLQISYNNKLIAATHGKGITRSDLFDPVVLLPVTFSSFTGNNNGNYNELQWNVTQEENLDRYVMERSTDGSIFQGIANVNARNSTSPTSYTYRDNISNNTSAIFYYRLKAVNNDGTYKYSEIVVIKIVKKTEIRVVGNPFYSHLTIQYNQPEPNKMQMRLFDLQGKLLKAAETTTQAGFGSYTFNDLSFLSRGTYVLEMRIGKTRKVEKIIKQ